MVSIAPLRPPKRLEVVVAVESLSIATEHSHTPPTASARSATASTWRAYLYALALLVGGCLVYYVTERWASIACVHVLGIYLYLFTGEAVNLLFGLGLLRNLPADYWNALHSPEHDHGLRPARRRRLRAYCAVFAAVVEASAMAWFDVTTRSDNVVLHNMYPLAFGLSGIGGNTLFYLYIVRHFPHSLRVALNKTDGPEDARPGRRDPNRAAWKRRLVEGFWANMCGAALMAAGILLYWVSDTWKENRLLYSLDALVFFFTGTASNIFFALWILPRLPEGMWDALHADEGEEAEAATAKQRRRRLRQYCYIFGLVLGLLAAGLYQLTTTSDIFVIRLMYPVTYWASCLSALVFFYLRILGHFPRDIRKEVHHLDELDAH